MTHETASDGVAWSLESYFPEFDGPEYRAHFEGLQSALPRLADDARALGALTVESAPRWAEWVARLESLMADYSHLSSYIGCLSAGDANNEGYQREVARLSRVGSAFAKAGVPFDAALKTAGDDAFEALVAEPLLDGCRYALERQRVSARLTMDPALEELAADLNVDGMGAWGRLYNTLAGRMQFEWQRPGGDRETAPMAMKNSLLDDPDPAVRKAVFDGSNAAWEVNADAVAACLNGIAGTRLTLQERRGVEHFLDVAMFQSGVERATIDTMWSVVTAHRPLVQRYLRLKARLVGRGERMGFQDTSCPLPIRDSRRYTWPEGEALVYGAFRRAYPRLADYAEMMRDQRRIESEKRPGKRPGAFCTSSYKSRESRVYMTYGGSLGDLQTLAHELGHAFHNEVMKDMRPMARRYPMTLAETASTFAEDIFAGSIIRDPNAEPAVRLQLLNEALDRVVAFLLNIHMRYLFEERFYTERAGGEVSVSRIRELVVEAQRECYGDVLLEDEMDPMFWASKLHFYITGVSFYNFPYTFGYLFSRGLSARFQAEGEAFLGKYEALLRLTGSTTAEGVARESIGVDLGQPDFWREALSTLEGELQRFEGLASEVLGG